MRTKEIQKFVREAFNVLYKDNRTVVETRKLFPAEVERYLLSYEKVAFRGDDFVQFESGIILSWSKEGIRLSLAPEFWTVKYV